jgi:AmmeMemoRadiSam system protein A
VLTEVERQAVLRLARQAIRMRLTGSSEARDDSQVPAVRAGAFVTLELHHELRGCIGYPPSDRWLADVIRRSAVSAAVEDPRFPPLTAADLPRVSIEVSVLGPLIPVWDVKDIEVGRDGLIVEQAFSKGLLLPQVASERNWDRETFLSHTCLKAGLPRDGWRTGAKIWRFEAEVFSEESSGLASSAS